MSVPDYEKLEFRICFIGEDFVGKKTLLNRFRNLKCTDTIEFPNPTIPKTKKVEKQRGKLCDKTEIKIDVPKIRQKIENLPNFTKIFRIEKNYFEINFFLVPAAEKVGFSDNLNEDDEVEKLHKMKFLNVKNYFQTMLQKPGKEDLSIRYIFLFIFDITIAESFDRIKVYYDEINKITNFEKNLLRNFFPVLIGNKIDLKFPYEAIDRNLLGNFIEQKGIKYFETSGKLYFNFENFFQKLFFDLFETEYPSFSSEYFKSLLKEIICNVKTIPSKTRELGESVNDVPGPQKYQMNVYDISVDPDFKIAFDRAKRYKNKIFLNKQGPVFDFKKDEFISRKLDKTGESSPKKNTNAKSTATLLEEEMRKRKIKEMNTQQNVGYSFGLKQSLIPNLKESRRMKNNSIKRGLDNIFDIDNITTSKVIEKRKRSNSSKSIRQILEDKKHTTVRIRKMKREKKLYKVLTNLNNISQEKIKKDDLYRSNVEFEIMRESSTKMKSSRKNFALTSENYNTDEYDDNQGMHDSYMSDKSSRKERIKQFLNQRYNIDGNKKRNVNKKVHDDFSNVGPAKYDIRGSISLKKNFSFGSKPIIKNIPLSSLAPKDTVVIRSDIDEYAEKPKFAPTNAKRFKQEKIYIPPYPEEIYKKLDDMTMRKYEKIRENILIMQQLNAKRFEKEKDVIPGPNHYFPNYDLIENNGFAYSIRAKLDRQNLQSNDQDDSSKIYGLEQSVTYLSKSITKTLNPLPDYNIGKENSPEFSFPRNDRFGVEKNCDIPGPDSYFNEDLFNLYRYRQNNLTQGTSVRFGDFKYSPIPGPGLYKIEGFADEVVKKATKFGLNKQQDQNNSDEIKKMLKNSIDKIEENYDEYEN